jgi:hypothetical protein
MHLSELCEKAQQMQISTAVERKEILNRVQSDFIEVKAFLLEGQYESDYLVTI